MAMAAIVCYPASANAIKGIDGQHFTTRPGQFVTRCQSVRDPGAGVLGSKRRRVAEEYSWDSRRERRGAVRDNSGSPRRFRQPTSAIPSQRTQQAPARSHADRTPAEPGREEHGASIADHFAVCIDLDSYYLDRRALGAREKWY
jgi:hypothetical protein